MGEKSFAYPENRSAPTTETKQKPLDAQQKYKDDSFISETTSEPPQSDDLQQHKPTSGHLQTHKNINDSKPPPEVKRSNTVKLLIIHCFTMGKNTFSHTINDCSVKEKVKRIKDLIDVLLT